MKEKYFSSSGASGVLFLNPLLLNGGLMPRRRVPRAGRRVISRLRSRVFKNLRVIYDDGVVVVSPSLDDVELECALLSILSVPLSIMDIQRVFSGLASGDRVRRVLDGLVRRGVVKLENGVYYIAPESSV
jgi:hypothetical protein